jgi:hypothetical protein
MDAHWREDAQFAVERNDKLLVAHVFSKFLLACWAGVQRSLVLGNA